MAPPGIHDIGLQGTSWWTIIVQATVVALEVGRESVDFNDSVKKKRRFKTDSKTVRSNLSPFRVVVGAMVGSSRRGDEERAKSCRAQNFVVTHMTHSQYGGKRVVTCHERTSSMGGG